MTNCELLIGGEFVTTQHFTQVIAPFDSQVLGNAYEGSWTEMDAAIGSATSAFPTWSVTPRSKRQSLLRNIATAVRENTEQLVDTLTREVGKPVTWSRGEVARTATTFDLAADLLTSATGENLPVDFDPRGAGYQCTVERFPIGAILAITPYNWPYNLAAHKLAPALAAGNTVVLKPSPMSPLSSYLLARLIHEAGCPAGVLNMVTADGPTTQRAAEDERVKMVSFTGSDKIGWALKELLPDKKVVLELGGDASVVIMPDADLGWAVSRTVAGAYGYAGQICISVQHVLVHEKVYEKCRQRLMDETRACPCGDPSLAETVCGPMINHSSADKVEAWIDEAENQGAKVLVKGARKGNMLGPTLVENVPQGANLSCNEVFGPVATLLPFASAREAIEIVNGSRYGIQAGVFTEDANTAELFYQKLEVGGVVINDFPTLRFDNMPYGGVKRSGFGREGVRYAFDEMTEPKVKLTRLV